MNSTIWNALTGKSKPGDEAAARICPALEIPAETATADTASFALG
jgi:hypothetical protein